MRFKLAPLFVSFGLLATTAPAMAEQQPAASLEQTDARISAVQAHIDAYRSGDLDRFVATFAKDAEVHSSGITAVGHKQIRAFYALNFKAGAPKLQLLDNGVDGDVIWISAGYVYANGDEMCCSMSEYQVRGGKISYLRSELQ